MRFCRSRVALRPLRKLYGHTVLTPDRCSAATRTSRAAGACERSIDAARRCCLAHVKKILERLVPCPSTRVMAAVLANVADCWCEHRTSRWFAHCEMSSIHTDEKSRGNPIKTGLLRVSLFFAPFATSLAIEALGTARHFGDVRARPGNSGEIFGGWWAARSQSWFEHPATNPSLRSGCR
jgi:hypothetical protein